MVYPSVFLIHSATLNGKRQNSTLAYDAGTAAFHVGATLAGATSHATAVIVGIPGTVITDPSGATIYTVPALTLLLHTITGTFQNDEVLSDNGTVPGAAVANGTTSEAFDINGQLMYTTIASTVSCRLATPQESFRGKPIVIVSTPSVTFAAGTDVSEGDTLTSTETGFTGTFRINSVSQIYEIAVKVVSHIMCEIAAAGATGGT
ncbi:MAG: hypothetical protein WC379_16865 [Methanoregula sp.]|jgi:hypothetical protein